MKHEVEQQYRVQIRELEERERRLSYRVEIADSQFSGLKEIDQFLSLIKTKLQLSLLYLEIIQQESDPKRGEMLKQEAQKRAKDAFFLLEDIYSENLSEDQKHLITEAEEYQESKRLFQQLLLYGGSGFFDEPRGDEKKARLIAKTVADTVKKFSRPDDRYRQLFKTERLKPFWKRIVKTFFYVLAPEHQKDPPYGIAEGEETFYQSEKINMPLSQAVLYYEEEILPMLEEMLEESPGDGILQQRISEVKRKIDGYKKMTVTPRSQPIVMPKDYYTEGITGYTPDGEPLISVALPVTFNSKTNLDRMQELVKYEITRKLAGKGVCPELDRQYTYLKGMESGTKGDSLFPSLKVGMRKGFASLAAAYPQLKKVEEKEEFTKLIRRISRGEKKAVQKQLEQELIGEPTSLLPTPWSEHSGPSG